MTDLELERSFGFILHETARLLTRRFDQQAKSIGLTRAQCQALAYLARHEGINQTGLAELMDIECISLARLIDRMEQAGWVERRPDPADRRARLLFMTEKAKPIFARIRAVGQEVRKEALAGLTAEDAERLLDLLLQVRANLSDRSEAPVPREAAAIGR
jgi:DNA-binding MarR family transcriptional regulator